MVTDYLHRSIGAELITGLVERGYYFYTHFLCPSLCEQLREDLENERYGNQWQVAQVGRGDQRSFQSEIRRDQILWPDLNQLNQQQKIVFAKIEKLRLFLNRELYLGVNEVEAHFSRYPIGAFYRKHVDQFQGKEQEKRYGLSERKISFIFYLNDEWQSEDGGELRLYARDDKMKIVEEILPRAGTVVCFLSSESYHEVLPAHRERFALTGWMR